VAHGAVAPATVTTDDQRWPGCGRPRGPHSRWLERPAARRGRIRGETTVPPRYRDAHGRGDRQDIHNEDCTGLASQVPAPTSPIRRARGRCPAPTSCSYLHPRSERRATGHTVPTVEVMRLVRTENASVGAPIGAVADRVRSPSSRRVGEEVLALTALEGLDEVTCLLCRVGQADQHFARRRVWQNELWRLSCVLQGPVLGFVHLEPVRHIPYITDLDGPEAATLGEVLPQSCAALQRATGAGKVYVYVFGDHVAHLHFNLAPHVAGDALRGGPGLLDPSVADAALTDHEAVAAETMTLLRGNNQGAVPIGSAQPGNRSARIGLFDRFVEVNTRGDRARSTAATTGVQRSRHVARSRPRTAPARSRARKTRGRPRRTRGPIIITHGYEHVARRHLRAQPVARVRCRTRSQVDDGRAAGGPVGRMIT